METPLKPLPRRLFELLEEQQEPFLLDVYLLENCYSKRLLKSLAPFKCFRQNSHDFKRKKGGVLRCLLSKFEYWEFIKKALHWDNRAPETKRLNFFGCFPEIESKANITRFHRLSSPDAVRDGDIGWKDFELSPVSVLDLHSAETSSILNHSVEEEKSSAFDFNSPTNASSLCFSPLPLFKEAKRERHPPRQLLLDLVKEIEEKSWDSFDYLGQERCGTIIEEIISWEKQRGDMAFITQLIDLDFSSTRRDWSRFEDERRETVIEIEGIILEEISEECVLDMLGFCTLGRC